MSKPTINLDITFKDFVFSKTYKLVPKQDITAYESTIINMWLMCSQFGDVDSMGVIKHYKLERHFEEQL